MLKKQLDFLFIDSAGAQAALNPLINVKDQHILPGKTLVVSIQKQSNIRSANRQKYGLVTTQPQIQICQLIIGEYAAKSSRSRLSSVIKLAEKFSTYVQTRYLFTDLPKTLGIRSQEMSEAIAKRFANVLNLWLTYLRKVVLDLQDLPLKIEVIKRIFKESSRQLGNTKNFQVCNAKTPLSALAQTNGTNGKIFDLFSLFTQGVNLTGEPCS